MSTILSMSHYLASNTHVTTDTFERMARVILDAVVLHPDFEDYARNLNEESRNKRLESRFKNAACIAVRKSIVADASRRHVFTLATREFITGMFDKLAEKPSRTAASNVLHFIHGQKDLAEMLCERHTTQSENVSHPPQRSGEKPRLVLHREPVPNKS